MFIEAIITAIIVSIDGFFSGVALGFKNNLIKIKNIFIISIIPIIMAIPVMIFGNYIGSFINSSIVDYIGFGLFLFLAFNSFRQIKNSDNNADLSNISLYNSIIVGITIGIDSSISAFSLALSNHNPFITPLYFGIFHGIFIYLGNRFALRKFIHSLSFTPYLSPILFLIIAIFKIL